MLSDEQRAFWAAIREAPEDDAPRLVYADWLEERGDPRADFLRAEIALASAMPDDPGWAGLHARLRETGAGIDPLWLAAVCRVPIENCGVSFRLRCPKRWEELRPTFDESVRFCESCRQRVYFCTDLRVAQSHAAVGECIAVDPRLTRRPGDLASDIWAQDVVPGLPMPEEPSPPPKEDEPPRHAPRRGHL